jgi:hypothetical protein
MAHNHRHVLPAEAEHEDSTPGALVLDVATEARPVPAHCPGERLAPLALVGG